jgi:hypothetical protein
MLTPSSVSKFIGLVSVCIYRAPGFEKDEGKGMEIGWGLEPCLGQIPLYLPLLPLILF